MGKKLTQEEFIAKARKVHGDKYDYSKVEYKNSKVKVCIVCPKHGHFWQTPNNHLKGAGCALCNDHNKYTTESFIKEARKVHGDKYNYSKVNYIDINTKITIICPEHGEFTQLPAEHLRGRGCKLCGHNIARIKNTMTKTEFIGRSIKKYGNYYDYSLVKYVNSNTKVKIICPIHGEFWQTPIGHLRSNCPCKKCSREQYGKTRRRTTELFIQIAKLIHGSKYDYSKVDYVKGTQKVCIICPKHGEFWLSPDWHVRGGGCPKCTLKSQSKLFNKLQTSFPNELIQFEVTKKLISWLKNKRLDIYFPLYNLAIEYDGLQHFLPVAHFGGEKRLRQIQYEDLEKNEICTINNCVLFRVPYNYTEEDFNNLVTNIKDIINNYGKAQSSRKFVF